MLFLFIYEETTRFGSVREDKVVIYKTEDCSEIVLAVAVEFTSSNRLW